MGKPGRKLQAPGLKDFPECERPGRRLADRQRSRGRFDRGCADSSTASQSWHARETVGGDPTIQPRAVCARGWLCLWDGNLADSTR